MSVDNTYYVYELRRPSNGMTIYVGKGKGVRISRHEYDVKARSHKNKRLTQIIEEEGGVFATKIEEGLSQDEALVLEAYLINFHKREFEGGTLTNIRAKGNRLPPEALQRMSEVMRRELNPNWGRNGEKHPLFGTKHSPERIAQMRARMSGKNNPMWGRVLYTGEDHPMYGIRGPLHPSFGKPRSPEVRAKISHSSMGKLGANGASNGNFGKFGADHPKFGTVLSTETKALMSKASRGKAKSPAHKAASKDVRRMRSPFYNGTHRERDVLIVALRKEGHQLQPLADRFSITLNAVRKIIRYDAYADPANEKYVLAKFR